MNMHTYNYKLIKFIHLQLPSIISYILVVVDRRAREEDIERAAAVVTRQRADDIERRRDVFSERKRKREIIYIRGRENASSERNTRGNVKWKERREEVDAREEGGGGAEEAELAS